MSIENEELHIKEPKVLTQKQIDRMNETELRQLHSDQIEVYEHYESAYYEYSYEYRMKRIGVALRRIDRIEIALNLFDVDIQSEIENTPPIRLTLRQIY